MKLVRLVFVVALLALPMGALAAEIAPGAEAPVAPVAPEYQALIDSLVKLLAGVVFAAVAWLLRRLDAYLAERWSLHLEFLREERVREVAQWAAAEAEEWARGKAKAGQVVPAGPDKLAHAVAGVVERLGIKHHLAEKAVLSVLPFFSARLAQAVESVTPKPETYSTGSTASDLQPNA